MSTFVSPDGDEVKLDALPVDGLSWVEADGTSHVYNFQEHVMLFFELGSVGIFPRADVSNPENFTPVTT